MKNFATLTLALALTACGSGQSSDQKSEAQSSAPPAAISLCENQIPLQDSQLNPLPRGVDLADGAHGMRGLVLVRQIALHVSDTVTGQSASAVLDVPQTHDSVTLTPAKAMVSCDESRGARLEGRVSALDLIDRERGLSAATRGLMLVSTGSGVRIRALMDGAEMGEHGGIESLRITNDDGATLSRRVYRDDRGRIVIRTLEKTSSGRIQVSGSVIYQIR